MRRLGVVAVLVAARAAWPCSGATCDHYFGLVPRPGSTIPANAPALGVQHALFSEAAWDGGTTPIELLGSDPLVVLSWPDGGAVPVNRVQGSHEVTLALDAGLAPGDVLLASARLSQQCTSAGDITVAAAAPLPSQSATISLANTRLRDGLGGFCGGPQGLVHHAQLHLEATSEMVPWLPLARWELEIDGLNYATSAFGAVTSAPRTGRPAESGLQLIDTFQVQCGAPTDGGRLDTRLAPGTHQVRLLARVMGVTAPVPSNTLAVTLDCVPSADDDGGIITPPPPPDDGGQQTAEEDAGLVGPDAGAGTAHGGTGGSTPPTGCGCGALPLPAALVALLALRRRRR